MNQKFDAIVVGAGHAGIEAARALAQRGFKTALLTLDRKKIGAMSCNPAIGGVAKGHLVFEIDALGGLMGHLADLSMIQGKRLNSNRGPAVRSTRFQCDKDRYSYHACEIVSSLKNLEVIEGEAAELVKSVGLDGKAKITGCRLASGKFLESPVVIVTSGTFMRAVMFHGKEKQSGGRFGDKAADFLTESILELGHRTKRLKTGTPARLKAGSIDFSLLEKQWGDAEKRQFSWRDAPRRLPQLACYITYTNQQTHEIIRKNFDKSPLFSGEIQGVGPRYCPSVEDKVKRFSERERHQIFLEPEGLNSDFIYPNGMSTSLPASVQLEFLRSIKGLENVELHRAGYAVEYDTIDPTQLESSFMSQFCVGLFFAGQVNRTSGYEEAAAQGLWAGINAGRFLNGDAGLCANRSRSYTEVLVDDLVSRGTEEPYRLFTSRSEHRLHLREDNAFERLRNLAEENKILSSEQLRYYDELELNLSKMRESLESSRIRIDKDRVSSLREYLKRPEVSWENLAGDLGGNFPDLLLEKIETEVKYSGYLQRQEAEIRELNRTQSFSLKENFDPRSIKGLSLEIVEKLERLRPKNVYELSRISGMTPSAVLQIIKAAGDAPQTKDVSRETQNSLQ